MSYMVIDPPCTLDFVALSNQDLKRYYDWFLCALSERLAILESSVRETPGCEAWVADFNPDSLVNLAEWFASRVAVRGRTEGELKSIEARLMFPTEVPQEELTDETFSIAMDVGMYFGSVLLKKHPSLRWDQKTDSKRFADYGQPVIVGFGTAILNPVRIAITFAYGIAAGTQSSKRLMQIYKYWSDKAKN